MSQRVANELEHRRGLVLGLTLAEVLLLLLFVLLLALTGRLLNLQTEAVKEKETIRSLMVELDSLKATLGSLNPLLEELRRNGGLDEVTVQQLVEKLARTDLLEREVAELKRVNSELRTNLVIAQAGSDPQKLKAVNAALSAAAEIDPNDPPAVLIRAVEILKRLGVETRLEQVKSLTEMTADAELREQVAALTADSEKYRRQVENMRGNGRTFPSCWMTAENQTEYIFDIAMYDSGLVVKDATLGRANDPDWELVQTFARNSVIKESTFQGATARLFEKSKKDECRYYAIIRDGTGETSKARYQQLRRTVENHFYPLMLPLQRNRAIARPQLPPPQALQSGIGGPLLPVPSTR